MGSSDSVDRVVVSHARTGHKHEDKKANQGRCNNTISTTKYSVLTFLPKNLFEQFMRVANFYFLIMMCIALVPGLSPITPITSILPLVFVISIAMIKQGYEDYLRHLLDNRINHRPARVLTSEGKLMGLRTEDVRVGDFVFVEDEEDFPCDIVLLMSSSTDGNCSITTTNLDGETGLKIRSTPSCTRHLVLNEFTEVDIDIETGQPVPDLYQFAAAMTMMDRRLNPLSPMSPERSKSGSAAVSSQSLDTSCLLLKGARLKGTASVLGLAVMTGKETKLGLNQRKISRKSSSAESQLNVFLLMLLLLMVFVCSFSVGYQYKLTDIATGFYPLHPFGEAETELSNYDDRVCNGDPQKWYGWLELQLCDFLQFMILYSYLIPISLYVTLELQKMVGAFLIMWDENLYDEDIDEPAVARASDLNEELALVQHVFADKTGTLTENVMAFQRCSVKGCVYNYYPVDHSIEAVSTAVNSQALYDCFYTLAICHTVQVKITSVRIEGHDEVLRTYNSSSTDEEALVKAASADPIGIVLLGRTSEYLELGIGNRVEKIEILHVADFSSKRMRMSVIAKGPDGRVIVYCKGADGRILPRVLAKDPVTAVELDKTQQHLHQFSRAGLRTLAVARRVLEPEYAATILEKLKQANSLIEGRNDALEEVYDELEDKMEFLGITAVEDKLQEGVEVCMQKLREAGCAVWMLTGDKKETAQSISLTAAHTSDDMKFFDACGMKSDEECSRKLHEYLATLERDLEKLKKKKRGAQIQFSYSQTGVGGRKTPAVDRDSGKYGHALIIDGQTAALALQCCPDTFFKLSSQCASVLGCRLSPIQKALIVRMIRHCGFDEPKLFEKKRHVITLAIGDGANDVAMIREADIGVGIMGKEGREAANSSDYAIAKFKYLAPLLLVHGHYCYHRISYTILYFAYKNVATVLPLFLFGFENLFSTQPLFDSWMIMLYNMIFTSLPVLFFGMFEKDLSYEQLLDSPSIYQDFVGNRALSVGNFVVWTMNGMLHGATAYYGLTLALSSSLQDRDCEVDLVVFGTAVYTTIFATVTIRIIIDTRYWTYMTHFGVWIGTFGSYILFMGIYTGIPDVFGSHTTSGVYASAYMLISDFRIWQAMIAITVFGVLLDLILIWLRRSIWPTRVQVAQQRGWSKQPRCCSLSCKAFGCKSYTIQHDEKTHLLAPQKQLFLDPDTN